jgi:acyl-CoA synthetase (AMP-forming)/AMP-acid ligase II
MIKQGLPSSATSVWGDEIVVTKVRGVSFRMYAERPRRVEELLAFADRWGARLHIVQGEREVTFADLRRAVSAKAARLQALGLQPGQYVLLLGWNSPDWVINFWACLQAGAVPVLANAWWSDHEVADAVALVRPALTLADAHGLAKLPQECRTAPWEADLQGDGPAGDAAAGGAVSLDEEELAVVIFTSGTSGKPKAVLLSHRSLLAGLHMLLHVSRRLPHELDETSGDVGLHTGPLFHIGGVQTLLRAITVGGTLVMPRGKYDPAEALELIERYRVSRWSAVPTMVWRLLDHPDVQTRDVRSLRSLTVGGAPVHVELLERIRTGLPGADARVPTGYGLTENGGQATAASGRDTAERPGSSGRALPCVELSFLPHEGLPDGEILLRSPTQMSGYLGDEDSPIDAEGWLHTGDLGHLDEDGHLWITGRSKDLIIRGGENIAPVAVERALMAIPGVVEAAVVGLPHPDLGEEVMAFVVTEDEQPTPDSLAATLRETLSSFAVPTRWHIQQDPLPTNHAGKVDKAALPALVEPSSPDTPGAVAR